MPPKNVQYGLVFAREFRDLGIFYSDFGSISIRDGPNVWITKSGFYKYSGDGFVLVRPTTSVCDGVSGEYLVHKAVLDRLPDYNCVIHSHSPRHVAFGNVYRKFCFDQKFLEMRKLLDFQSPDVSFVLRVIPNSFDKEDLALRVSDALAKCPVVLVKGHGLYVAGSDVSKARDYVLAIDSLIQQVFYERQLKP